MSGNPWMKFYPSDWRSDPMLRMCSIAARGLWMEMLCLMHEADPYGHLVVNKKPPSDTQLGLLTGVDPSTVRTLISELEEAGVFSRNRSGVIYSRRMVDDDKKAQTARKNGKFGGNPNLCKTTDIPPSDNPPDKGRVNGRDNTQKPEARYQKKETPQSPPSGGGKGGGDFVHFWEAYPSRGGATNPKKPAEDKFVRLVQSGVNPAVIIAGARNYAAHCRETDRDGTDKVKQAITFLNQQVYADYSKPQAVPGSGKWRNRLAHYRDKHQWDGMWGPEPGQPGCQAPDGLWDEIRKEGAA
jgi:hypothetical protein